MRKFSLPKTWFGFFIIVLLVLGVFFRFFNLEGKLYWHDEVYTTMRAAGFTRQEIDAELFQNRIFAAPELQKYQHLKPGSTPADTIRSLALEDPQHPPLFFLMARFWMQAFGSSLTASRTLPAILSLLALPLMYGLALELFASRMVAVLATALLALSPFDILFAQTARQYGLLTVMVIGSSFLLLRALRLKTWQNWGLYALATLIGLYTHPFFGLTLIAQGVYVLLLVVKLGKLNLHNFEFSQLQPHFSQNLKLFFQYLLAVAAALVLYSPWLVVLKNNHQRMSDTTDWARISVEFLYLVKLWILSFTALFFDLDFGFDNVWTYLLRLPLVPLMAWGVYSICRRTSPATWLFILTSIFVPFLMLALPDLVLGGKRSAVSRYLISCFPGVQLAVAYLLATKLPNGQRLWRGVLAMVLTGAIASCTVSAFADTWWCKDLSYSNAEVARRINATPSPLVLSDMGDDFTNMGDLISLSYLLNKDVRLLLHSNPPNLKVLPANKQPLVFRPSKQLREALEQQQGRLELVFPSGRLWRFVKSNV